MAFIVDSETGNMTLYQGDSGELLVRGLNTDKNYTVYFAFYNSKRKRLGTEISVESKKKDTVIIGDKNIGELNTVTVFPKKVEGFE